MKRQSWISMSVLLVLGGLVFAGPSSAKSTQTPVDFWEVACLVDPGMEWVSEDGILHGRGRVAEATLWAYDSVAMEAEIVGSGTAVSNANIELATGNGRLFGTGSLIYLEVSSTGTFESRWHASLTGWVAVSGRGVGQGTGEARGMKLRLDFAFGAEPLPDWLMALLPTACPPDKPLASIVHDTGFLHNPHGE